MKTSKRFWDHTAAQWGKEEDRLSRSAIEIIGLTRKYLQESDIILDYGCGTGSIANEIAPSVKEVRGIDFSAVMIEVARTRANNRGIKNVHFEQATIGVGNLQPGSFSVILAINILHLVEDLPLTLEQVNKLLAPGGYFISVSACLKEERQYFRIVLPLLGKLGLVPHVNIFSLSELHSEIACAGFEVMEMKTLESETKNHYFAARKIG
jgi:2-polyprenyl-3-methyl-5-hydroxy-6-metoxy-1,4-benzoquinol methylase